MSITSPGLSSKPSTLFTTICRARPGTAPDAVLWPSATRLRTCAPFTPRLPTSIYWKRSKQLLKKQWEMQKFFFYPFCFSCWIVYFFDSCRVFFFFNKLTDWFVNLESNRSNFWCPYAYWQKYLPIIFQKWSIYNQSWIVCLIHKAEGFHAIELVCC